MLARSNAYTPAPRTKSQWLMPKQVVNPPANCLKVPPGYKATLFAEGLEHPRWMALAPNGDIFVVESQLDNIAGEQPKRVRVLRDADGDGKADVRSVFAERLHLPFGIAFHRGYLYVANTGSVVRWFYRDGQLTAESPPETVIRGIPEVGMRQHWTRNILFDTVRNRLLVTIGSKENADIEESLRGVIVAYALDVSGKPGGRPTIVASGLRNPVGLAFHPISGKLWAAVNERDYLGDQLVPDFFTEIVEGGFYGWPYYFIGPNRDPRLPSRPDLKAKAIVPDVLLGAHHAPLGLVFNAFGDTQGRTAYIAEHGSLNRSDMVGYRVVRVPFEARGRPAGPPAAFVDGWIDGRPAGKFLNKPAAFVNGRPAGLLVDRDGSLLIADDWAGRIWRVAKIR